MKRLAILMAVMVLSASSTAEYARAEQVYGGSTVRNITIGNGFVWCATDEGVLRIDSADGGQQLFTTDDGLLDTEISSVAVSRTGDVWAGSSRGVSRLDGESWTKLILPGNQSLAETLRIVFGPQGNTWICTPVIQYQYNGLIWLSWALENVQRYATFYDVDVTPDGTVWFATMMGLLSYHEYSWGNYTGDNDGPGVTEVNAVAVDSGGAVWCGAKGVIYRLQDEAWTQTGPDGLYGPQVLDIAMDADGVMWASTTGPEGGGLSRFIDGSWRRVLPASETGGSAPACITFAGNVMWLGSAAGLFRIDSATVQVGEAGDIPRAAKILGNYPNPFNPATVIAYEMPESRDARLTIFNLTGQKVRSLVNGVVDAGSHEARWDGRDDSGRMVASGMYLASLTAGNRLVSHSMTLVR